MIKSINRNDIDECVAVIRASFLTVAEEFGFTPENAPRFTAFATTRERLEYQLETEHRPMYAFTVNNRMVGYYSLSVKDNNECELNNLCVLPVYRHNKIGTRLLEDSYAKAAALGCNKMTIGIVEENTVLKKWYEKNGFVHTGTQKFDFFPFTCGYMERMI